MNLKYNRISKFLFSAFLVIALQTSVKAQPHAPGDIAFTGYHSQTNSRFSFVLLKNFTAGQTISFTEASWLNATNNFDTDEGMITWTVPAGGLVAGKELTIDCVTNTVTLSGGGSAGTITVNTISISLNTSGDQIFAFTGTLAAPTSVLSGLHMNSLDIPVNFDACNTNDAIWDGACATGNNSYSYKPSGGGLLTLTTGTDALRIGSASPDPYTEFDNARFNCASVPAINLSTIAGIRAAVNNKANWTTHQGANPQATIPLPSGCNYLGLMSPPVFTLQPPVTTTICEGTGTSFTIAATGAVSYQWEVDNGGGFLPLSNNATYSGVTTVTLTITNAPVGINGYLYRCVATNGSGSTNSNNATLNVTPLPVNPTLLAKIPAAVSVADGTPVSATFNAGSGGTTCTDDYRYTTNGGGSYTAYTPGTNISTTGLAAGTGYVFIEGRRAGCASLCQNSYIVLAAWYVTPLPAAATTLNAGDIAFSGYTSTTPGDDFSFVLLKNIGPGTVINFTNNGWLSTNVFRVGEETVTWTSNAAYPAGTEIKISGLTATLAAGGSAGTATGVALDLSTSGDQILAYRGAPASPTFISAIHMNVYSIANGDAVTTTAAAWDGTANTTSSSALPTGLTTAVNAIWIGTQDVPASEFDNARYGDCAGPGTLGPINTLRAALNNQALWIRDNLTPPGFLIPTGCVYFGLGTPPNFTLHPAPSTVCAGTNTSFTITAAGAITYQWQVDPGTGFVNLSNDAIYSGVTTTTLNITGTPFSLNGFLYRCVATNGSGSTNSNSALLTVTAVPVRPSLLAKIPAAGTVADGTPVSATFNAGSGGTGCSDDFRYTVDGGTVYLPYTPGTNISTTGLAAGSGFVFIEGRRANCSAGCQGTYEVLAAWRVTPLPAAPTTLNAGDIAFSGYTSTSTNDDFSFVLLRNIGPGTVINFTDNGFQAGVLTSAEQTVTWTAPAGGLPGGTEITISGLTATRSGGGAAGTVTGTALSLNTSGDQVLAYRGTPASPTFISAIHMNVYSIANGDPTTTTAALWDGAGTGTTASALPPGLTTGVNCIWIGTQDVPASEFNNSRYGNCSGPGILGPLTGLRAALNNQANWISDNNTPPSFTLPTGCNYLSVLCPTITVTNPVNTAGTAGTAFSETFTSTGGAPVVTYSTVSTLPTGLSLSSAGVLSGIPTQAGTFPIVVTATDAAGCTGNGPTYTLVIGCPAPTTGIATPSSQTVCSGVAITTIVLSGSPVAGTVYNWTRDNNVAVTGIAASGAGDISGTLTNTTNAPVTVTFTITPTYYGTCLGTPYTATVLVNPTPDAVATPASQSICSGSAITTIVLSGAVSGTVFNWTRDNNVTVTGIAASGAGDISGSLINTTNAPVTVTFTITPTANGCPGTPITATVVVNPIPDVAQPANQVVCNNTPTAAVNFTGAVAGTVFNWTNNTPSIGLAASGAGNIASFNAINAGNVPVVATIVVTPVAPGPLTQTFNYTGAMQTFTVPAGVTSITIDAYGAQGGNGNAGSSSSGGTGGNGSRSSGTLSVVPGQVLNIFVGGAGVTPAGGFNGGGIGGASNAGGGGGASDVRFPGITAANRIIVGGGGGGGGRGGCLPAVANGGNGGTGGGNGVNGVDAPTIGGVAGGGFGAVGPTGGAKGIGCAGFSGIDGATAVNENGANGGTGQACCCPSQPGGGGGGGGFLGGGGGGGGSAGTTSCTGNDKGGGGGGAGGSNYTGGVTGGSTVNGVQAGNGLVTITYTAGGISCTGTPKTFTITVNPTPNAVATPSAQTICSGSAITTIALTGNVAGTVYDWVRDNNVAVTGIAASGAGDISGSLTNTTNAPVTVTFTITPSYTNAGVTCTGTSITATVVVNPIPDAVATPSSQTLCSGVAITTIVLSGNVAGTVFNWTRDNTVAATGIAASGSGNISGTLTNTTAAPVTVTFTITPTANGCPGAPITATVILNPQPATFTIGGGGVTVCPNGTTLTGPIDPNYTYAWGKSYTGFNGSYTSFGGTAQTQAVTQSNFYQLVVTNQYGCSTSDATVVNVADYVFNGSLGAGDPQQTGRINRFAVVSTCAAPKACPGIFTAVGARFYDSYTITNIRNVPVCATIGINSGCGTNIFNVAYLTSFNPAAPCANYLGDPGSSSPTSIFMEVTIPALGTIVVVVHEVNVGTGCGAYTLTVDVPRDLSAIVAAPPSVTCNGTSVLTAPPANSYLWNPGGATTQSMTTPPLFVPTKFYATLGYGNNGCTRLDSVTVGVTSLPPTVTCPGNISQNNTVGQCGRIVTYTTTVGGLPAPTVTYAFTGATTASGAGDGSGSFFNVGTTNVTVTVTNVCGTANCSFTVTITDNEPPTITTGIIASCYQTVAAAEAAALAATTATDNCPGVLTEIASTVGTCSAVVTVTVIDANSNSSFTTYNTRIDNTPPSLICPGPITVCGPAAVPAADILLVTGLTDNCPGAITVTHQGDVVNGFSLIVPYTITRTYRATDGCGNFTECTQTITVNPIPDAVATPSSQTICSGSAITTIALTGSVPGTDFSWTRDNNATVIGIASSGSGAAFISGSLTNLTNAALTVTFTITPSFTNAGVTCTGPSITATVVVNPVPNAVATPASQTICSGSAITTIVLTGNVAGTVYNWTRDNTVAVTGIAASGSGDISGSLTNTTNAPVAVTFTITPSYTNAGVTCTGSPITAMVVVNPIPNAVATPSAQVICSGSSITNIILTGNVVNTIFNWTRDNTGTVTGIPASGTGDIGGSLVNTTNAPVTVTFTITPSFTNAGVTCTGTPITATVVVNPIPDAVATPSAQTICSGSAITTIALTGNVAGTVYNWTRDNNASVTGIAASGSGNISGSLTNTTNAPLTVTFTITPSYTNAGVTCTGANITATVVVNPIPDAVATPAAQTICSGSSITTISISGNVIGTVFNWTRDNTATATGIAASGSGNISGALTNTTNAPVTVTFTITPSFTNAGVTCTGTPITATVVVNPIPNAVATPASQTICSGAAITTIALTGNVAGTVYNWTRNNAGTVTGIATSGSGNISGSLTNTTNAPVTVTFTITPSYTNAGVTCTGTPITATVLVNPTPDAVATPASQTICSGNTIITIVLSGNVAGTTFNWTRNNTVSVTGIAASGSGNISGALTNTTNAPVTVTFTITPTANGCPGAPITATVLVNPTPNAVAAPSSQTICSGGTITTIVLSGNVAGTTFNWTRDNLGTVAGIAASGSGNISGTLSSNVTTQVTVTFTITPIANGCPGPSITATVIVNPTPTIVCPVNIVVNAIAGTCSADVVYPPAVVTGVPAPTVTYSIPSGSNFPVGVTTVTVTASNICGTVSCSFTITVLDVRVPVITTQPVNAAVCVGGSVTFSVVATNAASYQWQILNGLVWNNIPGATASSFTVNNTTLSMNNNSYRVAVTGPCGTVVFSNPAILIVNPLPIITLTSSGSAVLLPNRSITITANANPPGGSYVWLFNGSPMTGITGTTLGPLTVLNVGTYNVIYTDLNGCVSTSLPFNITAGFTDYLWVYPNPNTGQFNVRFYNQTGETATLKVFNYLGQVVYIQRLVLGVAYSNFLIDLRRHAAGVYTVRIVNGSGAELAAKRLMIYHP